MLSIRIWNAQTRGVQGGSTFVFDVWSPEVKVDEVEHCDDHHAYADGRDGVQLAPFHGTTGSPCCGDESVHPVHGSQHVQYNVRYTVPNFESSNVLPPLTVHRTTSRSHRTISPSCGEIVQDRACSGDPIT
eukprot:4530763-Pyramimonas_sp.AAC.1